MVWVIALLPFATSTIDGKIRTMVNRKFGVVKTNAIQSVFRILLGVFLSLAGVGHLTTLRQEFLAQVPSWLPMDGDLVVVLSGIVEIILGIGLILLGDGTGEFTPLSSQESGFFAPHDAKDMKIIDFDGNDLILVANNNFKMQAILHQKAENSELSTQILD